MRKIILEALACILVTCLLYVLPSLIMYLVMGKTVAIITVILVTLLHFRSILTEMLGEDPEVLNYILLDWHNDNVGIYVETTLSVFIIVTIILMVLIPLYYVGETVMDKW